MRWITLGVVLLVVACSTAFVQVRGGAVAMVAGLVVLNTGFALLGLRRPRHSGTRIATTLLVAAVALPILVGFSLALLPARAGRLLGFPRVTGEMLVIVGLIPLVILPLLHAWWKDDAPSPDDIARLRSLRPPS